MSSSSKLASRAASSLVEVLREHAAARASRRAYLFLAQGEVEAGDLTYGELDLKVRALGAFLQDAGLRGERALLLYPPGLDFVVAFLGCLYAGVVAVPAYPPGRSRYLSRLSAIAADARPGVVLTERRLEAKVRTWADQLPAPLCAPVIATDEIDEGWAAAWRDPVAEPASAAFLQYTSGSTAAPKGIVVTHGNLLSNEAAIARAFALEPSAEPLIVSWLPLYHDMGLIGGVLQPLYLGAPCVLLPPLAFLQEPRRWLQAISRYRATTSGGPNFAYDLCVRKIGEEDRAGLDLSGWSVAFNGAEPVRAATLARFAETFAPFGFRRQAFHPCYGLAEATLLVSGAKAARLPTVEAFSAPALREGRVARVGEVEEEGEGQELAGCGLPAEGLEIQIVDPATRTFCPGDRVGEIWVAGASVAQGYWGRPEETARDFAARRADAPTAGTYLRTGDLGFLWRGELFVAGRSKDLVIVRGRNYYPQDVELAAEEAHPALRPGCGAAFAVEGEGGEGLVVVHEVGRLDAGTAAEALAAVRRALAEELDLAAQELVLIRAGTIPKTSSGKIQRRACRESYLARELDVLWRSGEEEKVEDGGAGAPPLDRAALGRLAAGARRATLELFLRRQAARAARLPFAAADPGLPLASLGLDSLAAAELRDALEAELGLPVSLAALLGGASLAEMADLLARELERKGPAPGAPARAAGEETGPHPLSSGQSALWFLYQLAPHSAAYNLAAAARVVGGLDRAALESACRALVARHPALRTTFHESGGEPVQQVHEAAEARLLEEDATAWSEAELRERLRAEASRPFDLTRGPLFRLTLFACEEGDVLFVAVHHIVADFASMAILARELGALYAAAISDGASDLATLPLYYSDYVRWQRECLAGPAGEELWAYWQVQLAGAPAVLELPTDRPRPPVETFRGAQEAVDLGSALSAEISALARERGVTPYAVLLTAFEALLHRYTGAPDLLVGSPASGRGAAGLSGLVGYFVNPLVLRAGFADDPALGTAISRAWATLLAALEHQDLPFPLLAERLQPERDPGRSPLFQALFVFHSAPRKEEEALVAFALRQAGPRIALDGLVLEPMGLPEEASPLDLVLRVGEIGERFVACLQYNQDLLDPTTTRRLLGHLRQLLAGADPELRISELPVLTAAERAQLLVEWCGDPAGETSEPHLCAPFERQAERAPDAVALVDGELRLTYRELNLRAERWAGRLRSAGAGPEVLVGLLAERCAAAIIGMLGVLKAGGAYVALDPAYPAERIAFMLADCAAGLVLTQTHLLARLAEAGFAGGQALLLDSPPPLATRTPAGPAAGAGNLAYLIYTSGSSGGPKGVAIEHHSAVALLDWACEAFPADLDGVLAATSFCFDLSVFELFAPLSRGGRIVLADNAFHLGSLAAAGEVTLVNSVPSVVSELLHLGPLPASVGTVNLAGEALPESLVRRLYAQATVRRVLNLYGPSEDTTYSTGCRIERGRPGAPGIGRPLAKARAYVLDPHLRPLPIGVPGELFLGGRGVARGYLNRPGLTAERFVPDPLSGLPGERLYRTGDLVRHRTDGGLEFLGRLDQQVKLHGFRIELGEIESALADHPGVRSAAVVAAETPGAGERLLVAYIVPAGDTEPEASELRRHLEGSLPAPMVPAVFVSLPSLPLTPSGKLDRRALPPLLPAKPEAGRPLGPTEERIAALWTELLGIAPIQAEDHFFALGGHSLLAMRLMARLRQAYGVDLPVGTLFTHPTLAAFARRVEEERRSAAGRELPPIQPAPPGGSVPLSFAQQRLWLVDRLAPGNVAFNLAIGLRLAGTPDVPALGAALEQIVERHAALRTRFVLAGGEPVQVVAESWPTPLCRIDLRELPAGRREPAASSWAVAEARRPFDLGRDPLLRGWLVSLAEREHLLLFVVHHIVFDAWSLDVFLAELAAGYTARVAGRAAALPHLPIQYPDFALWQREWMQGEVLSEHLAYWRRQLAGAPPLLDLAADHPRAEVQTYRGATREQVLPRDLREALSRLARSEEVTLFMVVLAAFDVLLCHETGREDLVVGTDVANRNRPEVEPLIGFFVNQLVLRTDLSGDPSFAGLLARVREVTLGAYAHQDLPFEALVQALRPERSLKYPPLFQVKLIASRRPADRLDLGGLVLTPSELETGSAKLDLVVEIVETPEQLSLRFNYNSDLFAAAGIARWMDDLVDLMRFAAERPGARLGGLREELSRARRRRSTVQAPRHREMSFSRHRAAKAKTVEAPPADLVQAGSLEPGQTLPLVLSPALPEVDLAEWTADHVAYLDQELLRHGAILFRGFGVDSPRAFESFASLVCSGLFQENGEHPRESVSGNVYSPVFYPPDQKLLWHNENSFNLLWPGKILFCCVRPADQGGETPIVDSRQVCDRLRPEIRDRFLRQGILYVRNYGGSLGLPWQTVFQTADRAVAEARCRAGEMEIEWKEGDRARTRAVRPAAAKHPRTGQMSWFNQAQHFHVSCLPRETRESLAGLFAEEDLPRNCYYGDGSPIPDEVMAEILAVYRDLEVAFPWQRGDVLLLDNVLVAHARNPFVGERKILVSMGEMTDYREV